jgi:chromosome segregation ATPase
MDERFDQVEGQIADTRTEARTTANDLRAEVKELRGELKATGKELRGEIAGVETGLRQEIAGVEARLRTQANEHRAESWEQFDRIHEDMRQMNVAILGLHQTMTRIAWSAAIALLAGVIGVLLSSL